MSRQHLLRDAQVCELFECRETRDNLHRALNNISFWLMIKPNPSAGSAIKQIAKASAVPSDFNTADYEKVGKNGRHLNLFYTLCINKIHAGTEGAKWLVKVSRKQ